MMSKSQNGMAVYRQGERGRQLQAQTRAAIDPFIPREYRDRLHYELFLRCAAQQLEGVDFQPETLIPALACFAAAGILPSKYLHHGYLVPYKRVITPIFGYQGLVHLAYQASSANGAKLLDVRSDLILEGDVYDDTQPAEKMVRDHRPSDRDPRQDPRNALRYAYARFRYVVAVGAVPHEYDRVLVMVPGELDAVRPNIDKGAWKTHPYRMYQKAPLRRACQTGQIPLAFLAGMALSTESAGERGDVRAYAAAVSDMARAAGVASGALDDAVGAIETSAVEDDATAMEQYLVAARPLHDALRGEGCDLDTARNHGARLAELRAHYGVQIDEVADGLIARIERDYERNS